MLFSYSKHSKHNKAGIDLNILHTLVRDNKEVMGAWLNELGPASGSAVDEVVGICS